MIKNKLTKEMILKSLKYQYKLLKKMMIMKLKESVKSNKKPNQVISFFKKNFKRKIIFKSQN